MPVDVADPVAPVIPADARYMQDLRHLEILDEDAQWDPFRFCGVTHDTPDAGFPSKSRLLPDICITRSDGSVELPLCEELDSETEQMLRDHYLAEAGPIPRRSVGSPADFLNEIGIEELCCRWNKEDGWTPRAERADRRRSTRRLRRRRLDRRVARLERQYIGLGSLPECAQRHYHCCWEQTASDLYQIKRCRGPWVGELLRRLEAVNPTSSHQTVLPAEATMTGRHRPDKPTPQKRRKPHTRKRPGRSRKHTSAKILVRKGAQALS